MNRAPDGRVIFLPRGRNAVEDLNLLADAIAAANVDLFNDQEQCVVLIEDGKRMMVYPGTLRDIISKNIVTKHLLETAEGFAIEYRPYEPDQMALQTLLTAKTTREEGGLIWRLPRAPRVLSKGECKDIGDRLQRGEPVGRVAHAYGADVAVIKRLAR